MISLGALAQRGFFQLDEITDMRVLADDTPRAYSRERPDHRAFIDACAFEVREGFYLHIIRHHHTRAKYRMGVDDDVAAELRIHAERHRIRINQRRPLLHGAGAQTAL